MENRAADYGKMRQFTDRVKLDLDELYTQLFDSYKRIDDVERQKRNDMIAVEAILGTQKVTIQEKFAHKKESEQRLYFEAYHTNSKGSYDIGVGLRSQANIIIYALARDELEEVYCLKVSWLKKVAKDEFTAFITKRDIGRSYKISKTTGETLRNGKVYTAYSYEFNPRELPDEAFVKIKGELVEKRTTKLIRS